MSRACAVFDQDGSFHGIRFLCPGCAASHEHPGEYTGAIILPVRWLPEGKTESPHVAGKPHWGFNGDFERPTFLPSVLTTWNEWQGKDVPPRKHVCHSFVRDGRIEFLPDCTHALAGQTVELPELEQ